MSEDKYFEEYKGLLIRFLNYLFNSEEILNIPEHGIKIYESVRSLLLELKGTNSDFWSLNINPPWSIPIIDDDYFENYSAYLVLGGEIQVERNNFKSYNFFCSIIRGAYSSPEAKKKYNSCCENGDFRECCRIVRRFHFDTSDGIPEKLEAKSHLQFGGICLEEEAIKEYEKVDLHYCLDNKIEIPRLPYPPLGIIELLDILLRQFNTPIDRKFIEDSEWIYLVKQSEDFRLFRYYSIINNYYIRKNKGVGKPKTLFETLCEKDCIF